MLVDLDAAKRQLRIIGDYADVLLSELILQAQQVVLTHIKRVEDDFDPENSEAEFAAVPADIQAATLLVIRNMYREEEPITEAVVNLLRAYRHPSLA